MAKTTGKFTMPRLCHLDYVDNDPIVQNGLAITPRRMLELTLQGTPISELSSANPADFIDGYAGEIDFEPPHIYQRHADIISAWNTQIEAREAGKKLADTFKQSKAVETAESE